MSNERRAETRLRSLDQRFREQYREEVRPVRLTDHWLASDQPPEPVSVMKLAQIRTNVVVEVLLFLAAVAALIALR